MIMTSWFISRYFSSGIMKCYISGNIWKVAIFWNSKFMGISETLLHLCEYLKCYSYTERATAPGKPTNLLLLVQIM